MRSRSLETPRLILRQFTEDDIPALSLITGDPEAMRYIGPGGAITPEQTGTFIAYFNRHWATHGFGTWGVVERETGRLIGWCGLQYLKEPEIELLYLLEQDSWGKGYAAEAARASIAFGFRELGLQNIVAIAWPANRRSVRVMEKIGMIPAGTARFFDADLLRYTIARDANEGNRIASSTKTTGHP